MSGFINAWAGLRGSGRLTFGPFLLTSTSPTTLFNPLQKKAMEIFTRDKDASPREVCVVLNLLSLSTIHVYICIYVCVRVCAITLP